MPDSADMATFLAAERTLLAWIRTGLALMGFGFVLARFGLFLHTIMALQTQHHAEPGGLSVWFGTTMILLGVVVIVESGRQYRRTIKLLRKGETIPLPNGGIGMVLVVVLTLLGIAMAGYLMTILFGSTPPPVPPPTRNGIGG